MTPPVQTAPCGVCRILIEVTPLSFVDLDLEQIVCPACARRLKKAHAWLKHSGCPTCTKTAPPDS